MREFLQTAIPVVLTAVLAGQVAVSRTDRCGPLMTVVVPWTIVRISPKPTPSSAKVRRVVTQLVR